MRIIYSEPPCDASIPLTFDAITYTNAAMQRDTQINARIPATLKAALENAARTDLRSVSSLVELILTQWLTERGFLNAPENRKAGRVRKGR